jgi:UDP-2,3-diacylglucosamine hydrolase
MPRAGAAASAPGASSQAVPRPFDIPVPAAWRAIDFISDLHLTDQMPATFEAWSQHLRTSTSDAVFMLGDLFEVWVGDDARQLPFERRCVEVIAGAAAERCIGIMVGNRDFLLGPEMIRACGAMALPDPSRLSAFGHRVLLTHGDALCLDDVEYQQFRREVRGARWQAQFLGQGLEARVQIAADIRRQSALRQSMDGAAHADVDRAAAVSWLEAADATELVHGHTHRPGSAALSAQHLRHVLSDWDLDAVHGKRAQVLRLSAAGWQRLDLRAGSPAP